MQAQHVAVISYLEPASTLFYDVLLGAQMPTLVAFSGIALVFVAGIYIRVVYSWQLSPTHVSERIGQIRLVMPTSFGISI